VGESNVIHFPNQPNWRNQTHIVTVQIRLEGDVRPVEIEGAISDDFIDMPRAPRPDMPNVVSIKTKGSLDYE
jgi:hypothetical protein